MTGFTYDNSTERFVVQEAANLSILLSFSDCRKNVPRKGVTFVGLKVITVLKIEGDNLFDSRSNLESQTMKKCA